MKRFSISSLMDEHRDIESWLDRLTQAIRSLKLEICEIRIAMDWIERHYSAEEAFLAALARSETRG